MKSKSGGLPEILRKFLQKNPIFLKPFTKVYRASKEIKKSNIKTFVIHCKTDKQVGIKEVDDLVSNIKNLSEYVILPRGGHRMEEFKIASLVDILNKK